MTAGREAAATGIFQDSVWESARRQHKVSIRGPSCGAARLSKPSDRAPLRSGDSSNLRQMLLGTMTMGALSHLLFLPN